jgi:N-glycosylase/DNA lyase
MNEARIDAVAGGLAALGYEGIIAFDRAEPEYAAIQALNEAYDEPAYIELLVICATTTDYQLLGDAQRFWREFERVALDHGSLSSK